ncbi:phytanoyl-CoA dioxygenase family protein [Paraburkholderia strydomiana]|uniref:phytanoyl-CoA dioxygenase family protein n=1 Tax=Paraburkholderia strydomiana TaxID=1245417 RepID=UPI0038B6F49F
MSQSFNNPLPGVPAVENPFFDRIFADPNVDEETRRVARDLRDHGFAIIDFPDDDFEVVADSIKSQLHDQYDWDRWTETGYQDGHGLRIKDAWKFNDHVKRIASNRRVLEILSTLFGRQAFPFQTLNFPVGTQQHYHTDSVHFSSVPERFMCGVWTALEDIGEEAGPLVYYPGSHKWPIFTNEHIGHCAAENSGKITQHIFEPIWQSLVEMHGMKPQTFTPRKGQALIWLANLLHGGMKQTDPTLTRWSQVTHYFFEDCAYYQPMQSDPFYGHIKFLDVRNALNGERVPNSYIGNQIPQDFIEASGSRFKNRLPEGFDAELYFLANPDVRISGERAEDHYLTYGRREGRPLRPRE